MLAILTTFGFASFLFLNPPSSDDAGHRVIKEFDCTADLQSIAGRENSPGVPTGYLLNKIAEDETTSTYVLSFAIFKPKLPGEFSIIAKDREGKEIRRIDSQGGRIVGKNVGIVQIVSKFDTSESKIFKIILREKVR